MTLSTRRFLLIDDDPLNNLLSEMALKKIIGDVEIRVFTVPESALEYIKTQFEPYEHAQKTTIILDINMPTLTGWEFIAKFKLFSEQLKQQFLIYILSSSIDPEDILEASVNPLVTDFIEKPLTKASITKLFC